MPTYNRDAIGQKPETQRKSSQDYKRFEEEGVYEATIRRVDLQKSKKGNDIIRLILDGKNGESGFYYLTFGTDHTEENLQRILASIEDNDQEIPGDINFGYNAVTEAFLTKKKVYIEVSEDEYNGNVTYSITSFLTAEEFEEAESGLVEDYEADPYNDYDDYDTEVGK